VLQAFRDRLKRIANALQRGKRLAIARCFRGPDGLVFRQGMVNGWPLPVHPLPDTSWPCTSCAPSDGRWKGSQAGPRRGHMLCTHRVRGRKAPPVRAPRPTPRQP
jgi:hypothetical protein